MNAREKRRAANKKIREQNALDLKKRKEAARKRREA